MKSVLISQLTHWLSFDKYNKVFARRQLRVMKQQHIQHKTINELSDKVKGVLWGAVLGDVIGAYLQFNRGIDENKVKQAFLIKGGGMHKLQPGQPTDDSELGYSIGKGLVRGNGEFNLNYIAQQMGNWFLSKPIDIGGTIRKSVPKACNMKVHQAHLCRKGAKQNSKQSQSNGTLMAITPLAIWCYRLQPTDIVKVVKQFTILIHPNPLVIYCNTFYVLMITYLINNCKNQEYQTKVRNEAFQYAKKYIFASYKDEKQIKDFSQWITLVEKHTTIEEEKNQENFKKLLQVLSPVKASGWIRIAFTYSIYFLFKVKNFKNGLAQILRLKGDTDTNACIGGGLMGAYYGFEKISNQLGKQLQIIKGWRPKNVKRPDWLVPGIVVDKMAKKLLQISPKQLKIVGGADQYKS